MRRWGVRLHRRHSSPLIPLATRPQPTQSGRATITERKGKPRHSCHPGCVIQCSQVYNFDQGHRTSGFEYETIWALGVNANIENLDQIAEADHTSGYTIATNILSVAGHVDPLKKQGQIDLSRNSCSV